jgi:type IV pilus assembly PilO-like protein
MDLLNQQLRSPYAPLIPWCLAVLVLFGGLSLVRTMGLEGAEQHRAQLESEWAQARQQLAHHKEAKKARQDLIDVWSVLPFERDFAPLALGITEEAKRDHVSLPALSYKTEATTVAKTNKGILQGTMTGRYEDLRRFLYDLETAEEWIIIEDLELVRPANQQEQSLTFNIKISTLFRSDPGGATVP